jgi:hypothetical protein
VLYNLRRERQSIPGHFCIHRTAALRSITVLDGFVVLKLPLLGGHSPLGPALDGGTDGARTSGTSRPQGDPADLSCDHVAEPARLSRHGLPHRRDIDAVSGLRGIFRCRRDAVWRTLESVIAFVMWSISFRLAADRFLSCCRPPHQGSSLLDVPGNPRTIRTVATQGRRLRNTLPSRAGPKRLVLRSPLKLISSFAMASAATPDGVVADREPNGGLW